MNSKRKPPDFLNGVPELLLLQLLARRSMYGYELVQAIKAATGQALAFGEGSIYPILHRLETERSLGSDRQTVNGRIRVVYHVTNLGRKRLAESSASWERIAGAIRAVLEGGGHVQPELA